MVTTTDWREQYDRMLRSRRRLLQIAHGSDRYLPLGGHLDALYHFFQDSYHLKDWLKAADHSDVERFVSNTRCLRICADLANGSKHSVLTSTRTGDSSTAVTREVRQYRGHEDGELQSFIFTTWQIDSDGISYDAHELADEIIGAWNAWLRDKGLISQESQHPPTSVPST